MSSLTIAATSFGFPGWVIGASMGMDTTLSCVTVAEQRDRCGGDHPGEDVHDGDLEGPAASAIA